ncbi:VWA domain-containing protein [Rubripirellula reticaptiva]|uniref:von Willebrand factor type A domain protein n=1 Tax=Rubripirellula reticaptiva TaxID=2528013 RepID=A0A5C6EUS7_9BACT|nr:VWA domain-containing protein [Rubripirellula reticaptiva]TWU51376.1 von Willebrand factor type A domain protein [Rubripirellula reticaptiva]
MIPFFKPSKTCCGCRWVIVLASIAALLHFGSARGGEDSGEDRVLFRQLTGRSEQVRLRALNHLAANPEYRRAVLPSMIEAARKHADEISAKELVRPTTVRLINLIGAIDNTDSETFLVELLSDDHVGIAMVAADILGQNKRYGAIEFLKQQIDRDEFETSYGFRYNLLRSIAAMEHPDAVEFLGEIEPKLEGQLQFEVEKLLHSVTDAHFLGDTKRYDRWVASRKPKIVLQNASFNSQSDGRIRFGKPQKYYDIDIHAKRMMFVIDRSGSMKDYDRGMTRLDRAKLELSRVIRGLPSDVEFGITFFESSVRQWQDKLLPATEANKLEALTFIDRLGYGDRTNTYGALRESLEFDEQLEVVFLLSDGRPTAGKILAPAMIVDDIMHRNRFRHVNFNTIGIAVTGGTESFLKALADQSSGEYRAAN